MKGLYRTRLYKILQGMKTRCSNPNDSHYKWYGAKGVKVCSEWASPDGVQSFIEWALQNGYADDLTIDRIDPCGDYSPDNCRWVPASENSRRATRKPRYDCKAGTNGLGYYKLFDMLNRRGLKKTDLMELAGISAPTLAKLSKGDTVTTDIISRLCAALGCQPADIMEYVDA